LDVAFGGVYRSHAGIIVGYQRSLNPAGALSAFHATCLANSANVLGTDHKLLTRTERMRQLASAATPQQQKLARYNNPTK
jgi:hypothetical protein